MLGVDDGHDGGAVPHATRPTSDLGDVEDGVATLDGVGIVLCLGNAVVRPQDHVGHSDVEAAVQSGLAATDRVYPPEGDGETAERLPVQVVVEVARVVPVQRGAITTRRRLADDPQLAPPGQRDQRRRGWHGPQDRRTVHIEERTVQHEPADVPQSGAPAEPVEPQRDDEPTRRVAVHAYPRSTGVGGDDVHGLVELGVVVGQIGGEVRGLAVAPGPAAFVQIQGVEGESARGETISQLGVEEVVGVAVKGYDRVPHAAGLAAAHQRRDQVPLTVGIRAEGKGVLPVVGQHIGLPPGLPRGHLATLTSHARALKPRRAVVGICGSALSG